MKGGCSTRKGEERALIAELLPRLYPGRRWGEPDDAARHNAGVGEREGRMLARGLAEVLEAPVTFVAGAEDEACDHIYVLCVGRAPGLIELRDRDAAWVPDGDHIRERYLRASLSSMARVATLQEVSIDLDRKGDSYVVTEKPRDGVYDPILLKRTRKLVDALVASHLTYFDFGVIAKPPEGFDPADYEERFGAPAAIVNYLFYPQPATAASTRLVQVAGAA